MNPDWREEYGGALRLHPHTSTRSVNIMPEADRLVFFWSDATAVAHELMPATLEQRIALVLWYYEKQPQDLSAVKKNASESHMARKRRSTQLQADDDTAPPLAKVASLA